VALKLVVGLGNPGPEYEKTRHNVGFRLADRLVGEADSFSGAWKDFKGLGVAAKAGGLWIAKPMTYMNLSGEFVQKFAAYHNIALEDILVVYDELAIPLGKIRLRKKGSSGGQKGMLSIIQHFGTEDVSRLRIGIGPQPERMDASSFVLGKFNKSEELELDGALSLASDAVGVVRESGIDAAMNRYNPAA
jgi:PTH1 family peptidyl-tRNA hydrolase